jgi:ADP-ribose pyrophosphatase YjhB (NUDIX family)
MKDIEILARAVLLDGNHILLVRSKGAEHTFLPGGHVRWGEALTDALRRELDEELGIACEVGPYLGAVEHAWEDASGKHHEINHCFLVGNPGLAHSSDPVSVEPQLEFGWVHEKDLDSRRLMPIPLRKLIRCLLRGERTAWWGSTL